MVKCFRLFIGVLLFFALFGNPSSIKSIAETPQYFNSNMPNITVQAESEAQITNLLEDTLSHQDYFLSKSEPVVVFETPQKPLTFGLSMAEALTKSEMSQSFGNHMYIKRLSFQIIPKLENNNFKVIMREFLVTNPGTPIEVARELSSNKKNQKAYFDFLSELKYALPSIKQQAVKSETE